MARTTQASRGSRWEETSHQEGEQLLLRILLSSERGAGRVSGSARNQWSDVAVGTSFPESARTHKNGLWCPVWERTPNVLIDGCLHQVRGCASHVQPVRTRAGTDHLLHELADCGADGEFKAVVVPTGVQGHSWPRAADQSLVQLLPGSFEGEGAPENETHPHTMDRRLPVSPTVMPANICHVCDDRGENSRSHTILINSVGTEAGGAHSGIVVAQKVSQKILPLTSEDTKPPKGQHGATSKKSPSLEATLIK